MESEFSGKLLSAVLKKYIFWILLVSALCGVLAFCITLFMPPVYSATSSFYVTNIQVDVDWTQSALVSAAQSLGKGYVEIIKSDRLLSLAAEELGVNVKKLRPMVDGKAENDTEVFEITVRGSNSHNVEQLMSYIAANAPKIIDATARRDNCIALLTEGGAVKIGPSKVSNAVIGVAVGAIISFIVFMIKVFFDRTVNTEEDLKNNYDIPVIGNVPRWMTRENQN